MTYEAVLYLPLEAGISVQHPAKEEAAQQTQGDKYTQVAARVCLTHTLLQYRVKIKSLLLDISKTEGDEVTHSHGYQLVYQLQKKTMILNLKVIFPELCISLNPIE